MGGILNKEENNVQEKEPEKDQEQEQKEQEILEDKPPEFVGGESSLLTEEDVREIRKHLPAAQRGETKWIKLYDNHRDGTSVRGFESRVVGHGPTIVVIKDTEGSVFGGFADRSWQKRTEFQGSYSCFVFKLYPKEDREFYLAKTYNENYMYFNCGSKFHDFNGLGFGGRVKYFTVAIEESFSEGHSQAGMSTYGGAPCLASSRDFKVAKIEVWGFPLSEKDRIELEYQKANRSGGSVLNSEGNPDLYLMKTTGRVGDGANYAAARDEEEDN